jgi:hypothetical protein
MKQFEINLANDLVLPARKRRLIYRAMLAYLLLAGGLLAVSCGKAFLDIRETLSYRHRARLIQQQFRSLHPGIDSMPQYADRLQKQIEECTQQAGAIRNALPADIRTVLPLLNVLVNQTDGSALYKLTLIQKNDSRPVFEFSIAMPTRGRKCPGPVFLQNWQKNPELAKQFAAITPATTIRGKSGNEDVFIMNYRVSFKE